MNNPTVELLPSALTSVVVTGSLAIGALTGIMVFTKDRHLIGMVAEDHDNDHRISFAVYPVPGEDGKVTGHIHGTTADWPNEHGVVGDNIPRFTSILLYHAINEFGWGDYLAKEAGLELEPGATVGFNGGLVTLEDSDQPLEVTIN